MRSVEVDNLNFTCKFYPGRQLRFNSLEIHFGLLIVYYDHFVQTKYQMVTYKWNTVLIQRLSAIILNLQKTDVYFYVNVFIRKQWQNNNIFSVVYSVDLAYINTTEVAAIPSFEKIIKYTYDKKQDKQH